MSELLYPITRAIKDMKHNRESYSEYGDKIILRLLIHKLMGLRTSVLCLTKLGTEDTSFTYSVEHVFNMIETALDDIDTDEYEESLHNIESLEDEINQCYTILSSYLPLSSISPIMVYEVEEIFDSVLENLDDFLSLHIAYAGAFVAQVETLRLNITFWRNFLHFATFLGIKQKEFLDLLAIMEVLAFDAAHFTVQIFSARHYNARVFSEAEFNLRAKHFHGNVYGGRDDHYQGASYGGMDSTISALMLKFNPLHNPHLYESYTRALETMKRSRESYVPKIDIQGFSSLLLSIVWEVLHLKDELQEMYEGLRYLRALFKKHPNKFDGEVGAIAKSGIFDAGVLVLSVYQNHDSIFEGVEEFLGVIKVIRTEVEEQVVDQSTFRFPKTTVLAFLDFLLDYLTEVECSNVDANTLSCIREHLLFLRSFMEKLVKLKIQVGNLHHLAVWKYAVEMACKMELLIDRLMLGSIQHSDLMSLQSITEGMKNIKTDSEKIFDEVPLEVTWTDTDQVSTLEQDQRSILSSDEFVGFGDERKSIINRLTGGSKKLQVVAIVGMPGLGKTTLATKVYNEPSVQQHFPVHAKCSFSQEFNQRKVLLELLNQITGLKSDEGSSKMEMTEVDLADQLRRSLLRRRYLIYIDDVWEVEAFESFKLTFPVDSSGRILLTSRIGDVAKLDDEPLFLRQLTSSESLELLQRKVSLGKDWPQSLYDIAVKIAENCKGLPLTITIVAGLLATTKQEVWEEVLGSLTSGIISGTDQCERTIELSYKHLPEHLKPCLLSFGSFPEDEEISVKRLIWLWIAEGFVRKTNSSSSEEVAADYLKDLIGRSLVMNSQKRNGGRIKTCRIHDLLLDFCQRKANEENSLHLFKGKEEMLHFEESRNLRRLCVHSNMKDFLESKLFCPSLRSLSFFGEICCDEVTDMSFIFRIFKLLRVFNMENARILSYDFPGGVGDLVHLRYLAITVTFDVSPSVGNLSELETFIIDPAYETLVTMPDTFWNLRKLRHLLLKYKEEEDVLHGIILPVENSCNFVEMESLSGLHCQHWCNMENHLRNFPNIRRLKCWLYEFGNDCEDGINVMSFSFLSRLESLTLSFDRNSVGFEFSFPQNIKKLHLSGCCLSWEKISTIAELPSLEVLKLLDHCFIGEKWQMEEGKFSKLRFLELEGLDVINWTGYDDQFPNLEKLVMIHCEKLEEIPECLESVETLERIEIIYCSDHIAGLFETVADYLKDRGNSVLQVHVHPPRTVEEDEDSADDEDEDSANEEDEESADDENEDFNEEDA